MTRLRRNLTTLPAAALVALALAVPAGAQGPIQPGGDSITSDNVEHIGQFRQLADGVGARIVGDTMYATSTTGLFIFDVSDPAEPVQLGNITADIHFENEDVPTNGKILGIADSLVGVNCVGDPQPGGGCLKLYDVSDPASPELISSAPVGAHTFECVFDCTWFYGSEGQIVDARDPQNPKIPEDESGTPLNWATQAVDQGYDVTAVSASPHDVTEVAPGYVVSASQPMVLMSLHPEHGGSPEHPVVIASASNEDSRFIHSVQWPRNGRDKFMLVGGETVLGPVGNGGGPCNDQISAFMTWDASSVLGPGVSYIRNSSFTLVDEVRPFNGNYADGGHPYDAFGCSVHWFDKHPTFRNGGVVLVSMYEHGTRVQKVSPEGKLSEEGFALPINGAASLPVWAPDGKHFYTLDYTRGMDLWRYDGENFQGPADPEAPPPAAPVEPEALALSIKAGKTTRRGVAVRVRCSRACTLSGTLKKGRRTVASARARRAVAAATLRFRVSKRNQRSLRRGTRLTLRLTARAEDGRSASAVQRLRVR